MASVRDDPQGNGRRGGKARQRRVALALKRLRALDSAGLQYADILGRAEERKLAGVDEDALCAAVLVDGAAGVGEVDDVRIRAARSHFLAQREIRASQESAPYDAEDRASRFASMGIGNAAAATEPATAGAAHGADIAQGVDTDAG